MKIRNVATAAVVSLSLSAAGPASAEVIAGWDFSQYIGDGFLSIDGASFTDVLDANYSALDPTNNAGAESADFGTMYINGQFGSTTVPGLGTGAETFVPTAAAPGSLASNIDAPFPNPFDSFTVLASEGQTFTSLLSMTATENFSVVFEATLSSIASSRSDWVLTFGGRTFDGTSSAAIDFSTDGSSYDPIATVDLDTVDTRFEVPLDSVTAETVFVRMTLDTVSGQPIIDNVAIEAPEPGAVLSMAAMLGGLVILRRRASAVEA